MSEQLILIEEAIDTDHGTFGVFCFVEISNPDVGFTFHLSIKDHDQSRTPDLRFCDLEIPFSITNPIDGGVILWAASQFSGCVAFKMAQFTLRKGRQDYDAWMDVFPDSNISERVWGVAKKFQTDAPEFKGSLKDALVFCGTFGLWKRGGDGEDDGGDAGE